MLVLNLPSAPASAITLPLPSAVAPTTLFQFPLLSQVKNSCNLAYLYLATLAVAFVAAREIAFPGVVLDRIQETPLLAPKPLASPTAFHKTFDFTLSQSSGVISPLAIALSSKSPSSINVSNKPCAVTFAAPPRSLNTLAIALFDIVLDIKVAMPEPVVPKPAMPLPIAPPTVLSKTIFSAILYTIWPVASPADQAPVNAALRSLNSSNNLFNSSLCAPKRSPRSPCHRAFTSSWRPWTNSLTSPPAWMKFIVSPKRKPPKYAGLARNIIAVPLRSSSPTPIASRAKSANPSNGSTNNLDKL